MEITSSDPHYFEEVKNRSMGEKGRRAIGVRESIHSTFEAKLYISECRRKQHKPREKDGDPVVHKDWKKAFRLEEANHICRESHSYYAGQKILRYDKTKLLVLTHSRTLKDYVQQYREWIKEKNEKEEPVAVQRGRLFEHFVDY